MNSAPKKIISDKKIFRPALRTCNRFVIIGCGGIGSHLFPILARELFHRAWMSLKNYIQYGPKPYPTSILLIDADLVEERNLFRQDFSIEDINSPKSSALASKYKSLLGGVGIHVEAKCEWVDVGCNLISDGDVILMCVDNNTTRLIVNNLISEHPVDRYGYSISKYNKAHLISGGNSGNLATVHLMSVESGKIMTAPLTYRQPDIANPDDLHPKDVSCMDAQSIIDDPQVFRANHQAATIMNNVAWSIIDGQPIDYCQIWSDISDMSFRKEPIPEDYSNG
jgi:hypothetical protein